MKKLIFFIFIVYILSVATYLTVYATDLSDADNIINDIENELFSSIDNDVLDTLEDIGLKDLDFENIYNISFENLTEFFSVTLKEKILNCFELFFELLGIVLLTGIITTLLANEKSESYITLISVIVITLLIVNLVSGTLSAVISVLEMSRIFMLSFIPIYTLLVSLSGNSASALTYNTFAIGFAEIISSVITSGLATFTGTFFCLGISFTIGSSINMGRIFSVVNKVASTVLGLCASLFAGFLGLKNILSASVDSLSVRGIRFLVSSMIPVVGSSISEAYSSFLGSINLIKSSVAVVGILVIIIINVPVIFEVLTFYISFSTLSYISDSLNATKTGDIFRCFSCGIRILLLLVIFEMFILIISTGILLSVKNGG